MFGKEYKKGFFRWLPFFKESQKRPHQSDGNSTFSAFSLENMKNQKRGQLTIFIILAVLVVAGVVLTIVLMGDSDDSQAASGDQDIQNPSAFLRNCMRDDVRRLINEVGVQGGPPGYKPNINFKFFNDTYTNSYRNISYLCHTTSYLKPCGFTHPSFILDIENYVADELSETASSCLDEYADSQEERGYDVEHSFDEDGFYVGLRRDKVVLFNETSFTVERANSTNQFDVQISYNTKLHNLAMVANEIANQQSRYCSFNIQGYTNFYNEYEISKENAPNATWIYTVGHEDVNEIFRFAVRSCVPFEEV